MSIPLRIAVLIIFGLIASSVWLVQAQSERKPLKGFVALPPDFAPELPPDVSSRRFALLIGNAGYSQDVGSLKNPHNDVDLVSYALERLGFKVFVVKDATKRQFETSIDDYVNQLNAAGSGISFFYYSGQGTDRRTGTHYLIPIDFKFGRDSLWDNSINADLLVARLAKRASRSVHYIVFDTDRHVFPDFSSAVGMSANEADKETYEMPLGLVVAYATAPGKSGSDEGKRSSPYAEALAEEIGRAGIESVTMFRNVHFKVRSILNERANTSTQAREQNPTIFNSTFPLVYLAGKDDDVWVSEKRLALLIGNQDYAKEIVPLVNPHDDVNRVGDALKKDGFEVMKPVLDGKRNQIMGAILDFGEKLNALGPGAVGFLYYSGHGAAVGDKNYLIPVEIEKMGSRDIAAGGLALSEILEKLQELAPDAVQYLVFDACRNNLGGSRGGRGFVAEQQRSGMFIAYASDKDRTASDDGFYAKALAEELVVKGKYDQMMFHRVRVKVDVHSNGEQIPWTVDGIRTKGRFYFAGSN